MRSCKENPAGLQESRENRSSTATPTPPFAGGMLSINPGASSVGYVTTGATSNSPTTAQREGGAGKTGPGESKAGRATYTSTNAVASRTRNGDGAGSNRGPGATKATNDAQVLRIAKLTLATRRWVRGAKKMPLWSRLPVPASAPGEQPNFVSTSHKSGETPPTVRDYSDDSTIAKNLRIATTVLRGNKLVTASGNLKRRSPNATFLLLYFPLF